MRICRYTVALLLYFSNLTVHSQDTSDVSASFDFYYREGLELKQAGRYQEAIASFKHALRVRPDNIDAHIQLAQTLSWNREYRRAEETYRIVLGYLPDHFDARFGLAQTLAWQADYDDALQEFQGLLVRHSENPEILRGIGQVYFWTREYQQGADYLERAVLAEPKSADSHLTLADIYYELGEWKRAHEEYQIVVSLAPSNNRALDQVRRTRVLMSTNQVDLYGFLEHFSQEDRNPHYALTVRYERRLNRTIRLYGRLGFVRKRFGNIPFEDGLVGTGVAIRLATKSAFSASLNVAPHADVIPRLDFTTEFSQSAVPRTEFSITYRRMDFENTTVNIISPSLTYYLSGSAWAMFRVYGAYSEGADRTSAVFGRFTYTFSNLASAWIGFTEGNEVIRSSGSVSLGNLRNLSSRSYLFHLDYSATSELTLLFDYQYLIRRGLFIEHAFGLGIRYRW